MEPPRYDALGCGEHHCLRARPLGTLGAHRPAAHAQVVCDSGHAAGTCLRRRRQGRCPATTTTTTAVGRRVAAERGGGHEMVVVAARAAACKGHGRGQLGRRREGPRAVGQHRIRQQDHVWVRNCALVDDSRFAALPTVAIAQRGDRRERASTAQHAPRAFAARAALLLCSGGSCGSGGLVWERRRNGAGLPREPLPSKVDIFKLSRVAAGVGAMADRGRRCRRQVVVAREERTRH
jgi:hypothetical protein